jgi:glutaminyl-peptide cyclotransferase
MTKRTNVLLAAAYWTVLILAGCIRESKEKTGNVPVPSATAGSPQISYRVVQTYPHDTTAFTEGLLFHEGKLYESTGSPERLRQTRSLVGEVDLRTGRISPKIELDRSRYFGEGIVFLNDKLYWLTYKTRVGFIYDAKTFQQLGSFALPGPEGWGLTTDGTHLIMSDGSRNLTFLDTTTHTPVKTLKVYDEHGSVRKLNELEYINGFLYANIYPTPVIVRIDPATGKVAGRLDLSSLAADAEAKYRDALEMNGIAFNPATGQILVTGKLWPTMYQIHFDSGDTLQTAANR